MLRSTRTVVLLGIAVQLAAFLRTAIIAATLGASSDVDAYNLGLTLPSFLSTVISAWLQLSFVGRYTALHASGAIDAAISFRSRMLLLVLCTALASALTCFLLPRQLVSLFMPPDRTSAIASTALALKFVAPNLVFLILADFLALILNSHGRFFAAALAPLINAVVSSFSLLLSHDVTLSALIATLILGSLAQFLVITSALAKLGLPMSFGNRARDRELRTTLLLALPLLPAMILSNFVAPMVQFRAAEIGDGVAAIYGYASKLNGALAQVLVMGVSTVLLPHFAALWSNKETKEILRLFRRLVRATMFLAAYATLGIYLMGDTATKALFTRGAFSEMSAQQVSWLWTLLSMSLFPAAFGTFIAKFCQALRGAGSILLSSSLAFATTWLVAGFGASHKNLDLIVGAIAISSTLVTCYWLYWLSKRIPIQPILGDMAVTVVRLIVILVPAAGFEWWLSLHTTGLHHITNLLVCGMAYTIVAVAALLATRSHRWLLGAES